MSVKLYSEYYYKGHEIILIDINTADRINLKELCIIKSVINNTNRIIRLYADARIIYVHCVLPNTHEPIIYFNRLLYNTVIFDEYIEENIKECLITRENNLKDFKRLRNTTIQEFKRRRNIREKKCHKTR